MPVELAVGPAAEGWDGPAVLGSARATGTVLIVDPMGPGRAEPASCSDGALMPLAGPAVLACAAGADHRAVRGRLDELCGRIETYQRAGGAD